MTHTPARLKLFTTRPPRDARERKERERRRREGHRAAQGRYRQRLADEGVPEIRELEKAALYAYVRNLPKAGCADPLTGEFLTILKTAGFSIEAVTRRIKSLRRRALDEGSSVDEDRA